MAKQGLLGSLDQFNHDPTSIFGGGATGLMQGEPPVPGAPDYRALDPTPLADNWQPKNVTVLGALADAYLRSRGQQPIFQAKVDEDNMQNAMANYAYDPLESIKRLARIPGHEADAAKLYQSYVDDQRQQGNLDRQNQLFDLKLEEIVRDRTAGILGTITPQMDDATKQHVIQMAKTYASGKGFGDIADTIPNDASQVDIDAIRYGEVPVAKQESLKRADERIDQGQQRIDETKSQNDIRNAQARENEAGRNRRAAAAQAGANARHNSPAARPQATTVMTKYGVGMVNKDKTQMLINHNGKHYLYAKGGVNPDGTVNWVPQGEVQVK